MEKRQERALRNTVIALSWISDFCSERDCGQCPFVVEFGLCGLATEPYHWDAGKIEQRINEFLKEE